MMAALLAHRGPADSVQKEDVNITFEDQKKINTFANKTNRLAEIQEEIKNKKKDLVNLQDAADELELADDDVLVPYQIGEVFVNQSLEEVQKLVEEQKEKLETEIKNHESEVEAIKKVLSELKVQLYAKFGNNINLEMEDE